MSSRSLGAAGRRLVGADNPFAVPPDEEIFKMRELERKRKEERRAELSKLKVWEKLPDHHRSGVTKRVTEDDIPLGDEAARERIARTQKLVAAATAAMTSSKRRDREDVGRFIEKKREMFLVQMSLNTKREEIQKLERRARRREEALKASERQLEEDALRFDHFLKANDREAYAAMKDAERETQEKHRKLHEIKRLRQALNALHAEMVKLDEALAECGRFRDFLEMLTPGEWTAERKREKRERQEARRVERFKARLAEFETTKAAVEEEVAAYVTAERRKALREGRPPPAMDARAMIRDRVGAAPTESGEELTSSGEELPMYFTDPSQLLQRLEAKEAANLFLIGQNQVTEQQLEELRAREREAREAVAASTEALERDLSGIKSQIESEEKRAEAAERHATGAKGDAAQQKLLEELGARISAVYKECIGDLASKPTRIGMLTKLEGTLEALLAEISTMPREYVEWAEKRLGTQRRKRRQEERKAEQAAAQKARLEKSLARSSKPAVKRAGRPVMFRSRPAPKKKKEEKPDPEKLRELEDLKFLS